MKIRANLSNAEKQFYNILKRSAWKRVICQIVREKDVETPMVMDSKRNTIFERVNSLLFECSKRDHGFGFVDNYK